jgi:hypothetical protein
VTRAACVAESHRFVTEALDRWTAADLPSLERACELLQCAARALEPARQNTAGEASPQALAAALEALRRDTARLERIIDICRCFYRRVALFGNSETEREPQLVEA